VLLEMVRDPVAHPRLEAIEAGAMVKRKDDAGFSRLHRGRSCPQCLKCLLIIKHAD